MLIINYKLILKTLLKFVILYNFGRSLIHRYVQDSSIAYFTQVP